MSKSLGNFFWIKDVRDRGFEPLALRYLFLTSCYRDKMNFTWDSLSAAQTALISLREIIASLRQVRGSESMVSQEKLIKVDRARDAFKEAVNNDLAIPQALAITWEMLKSDIPAPDKLDLVLDFDRVLGLKLSDVFPVAYHIPAEVQRMIDKREVLRKEGKWQEADEIRRKVGQMGFIIEDTLPGPKVRPINS